GARYKAGMWRVDPAESPAGGLAGSGIHVIDALIHLAGPIERILAQSGRLVHDIDFDDTTTMLMRFRSGANGFITCLTATAPIFRLQVFGSNGWAELSGETVLTHQPLEGPRATHTFPAYSTERAQLEAFASAIATGTPFPIPFFDVVAGVAAFEAVSRSAQDGRWTAV
ncbi:MAG: Gfo/Idh/MocA family oxidoreductase, partial [Pseudomonadota bacterium]